VWMASCQEFRVALPASLGLNRACCFLWMVHHALTLQACVQPCRAVYSPQAAAGLLTLSRFASLAACRPGCMLAISWAGAVPSAVRVWVRAMLCCLAVPQYS